MTTIIHYTIVVERCLYNYSNYIHYDRKQFGTAGARVVACVTDALAHLPGRLARHRSLVDVLFGSSPLAPSRVRTRWPVGRIASPCPRLSAPVRVQVDISHYFPYSEKNSGTLLYNGRFRNRATLNLLSS